MKKAGHSKHNAMPPKNAMGKTAMTKTKSDPPSTPNVAPVRKAKIPMKKAEAAYSQPTQRQKM